MLRYPLLFIIVFMLSGCGYNDIQSSDEKVNSSWAEVLNQYQRRADLVPNLVATVKGYSSHEASVLEAVTKARANAMAATAALQHKPDDLRALQQWQQSQQTLTGTLSRLNIISESYPELKADSLYRDLMVQLEGTENRIAVARGRYVVAVQQYNTLIRQFPGVLMAKLMGYHAKVNLLSANEDVVSQVPTVNFGGAYH
ncbi:LemA family protein [Photorhabdus australis subsp. thailandensis]|uniref:LemA family protein n=1 Tax=Photorhabdus australis subsp. thailandensis TaxID=2805096 RepID=A0A1C0U9A4_9GAMM|nr:LemA family protein [Photorhabdus australis]OCQ54456.1 LemA family protein [Photorhabdus australis subsp. thailandensis]